MAVTISDIAKEAGVSISTVSRVMNGTKPVSPELKDRVYKVIKKNNFKPNTLAQGLVTKKTNMIGVIVSDISNVVFGAMTKGINRVCEEKGYTIMICESGGELERELKLLQLMEERQIEGVLFVGIDVNQKLVDFILGRSYPTVLVTQDASIGDDIVATVVHNNVQAMSDAVMFLVENGHRRIAYLGGPKYDFSSGKKRLQGYKSALTAAGIEIVDSYIEQGEFNFQFGYEGMKRIYEENSVLPTAVVTGSDVIALGAIQFLKNVHMDVPGDISVMGFDDSNFSTYFQPELSTVRISYDYEGEVAAKELIRRLEGETAEARTYYVPHKIIRRSTTKTL